MTRCALARGRRPNTALFILWICVLTTDRFNSYTQQLCVNDAVVKDNRDTASDKDLKPKLSQPGDNVSQKVSYTSKFVEHASDVTEAMNISGQL